MNNIVLGMLAHVDAGKTTTAEAMLYKSGQIRSLGRVDHGDAFLDTGRIERQRGITIFSKQARLQFGELGIDLLDTPGHIDFSAEMERTLSVLDYAVLVISAPDGVQAHTETLWSLLSRYHVPVFLWINKMDLAVQSKAEILAQLQKRLGNGCVDFSGEKDGAFFENIAVCDEEVLERYLEREAAEGGAKTAPVTDEEIASLIERRRVFPCWFGSALKLEGTDAFLNGLVRYARPKSYPNDFRARVFKITRDERGERLSWLKVTGGLLRVRDILPTSKEEGAEGEKVTQIRLYSGIRSTPAESVAAGCVCAVCGLDRTYAGQGLGGERDARLPVLEPVLSYTITLPPDVDVQTGLRRLSLLAEEDPQLRIVWDPQLREIQARLMGEVQTEVLKQTVADRFGMDVAIGEGRILYRETIAGPVEGVGHFEPLRHYAEVHLLLEPLPAGSGILYESACSTDALDLNWQRLILGSLMEKQHVGVLTGSPVTDMKVTLVAGRAHLKHTEGGDFRQASWRALRQGLMEARNVLLEPWYAFRLEVPSEQIGRVISDVKGMAAVFEGPEDLDGSMVIRGSAPVSEMKNYHTVLLSYTKGRGKLTLRFAGYRPCHDTARVVEAVAYDPNRDVENTADSVFCSHGAGVNVKWNHVRDFMHLDSGLRFKDGRVTAEGSPKVRSRSSADLDERELEAIMEREFGAIKRPQYTAVTYDYGKPASRKAADIRKDYLIVDGYNVIFAWDELKKLAKDNIGLARLALMDRLANYRAFRDCELVLVFDGYKVAGNEGTREDYHGIRVAYTKDGETADAFIERLIHDIGKNYNVRVATSDGLIQISALRSGVLRMSARELAAELAAASDEIADILADYGHEKTTLGEGARFI